MELKLMFEYQKDNNIECQCIINTLVFRDYVKVKYGWNIKAKAVIVICPDEETDTIHTYIHMICDMDTKHPIEVSYDVHKHNTRYYYDDMSTALDSLSKNPNVQKMLRKKQNDFKHFKETARRINLNAHILGDDVLYHLQMMYLMKNQHRTLID